jgi:hypothetical protein
MLKIQKYGMELNPSFWYPVPGSFGEKVAMHDNEAAV